MSERASRKDHPAGGLLRVQDRMPVGDGRGRGSWGRRGTLGATGPRRGGGAGHGHTLGGAGQTVVRGWTTTAHPDGLPVGDGGEQGSWAGMLDGAAVLGETSASLGCARLHA